MIVLGVVVLAAVLAQSRAVVYTVVKCDAETGKTIEPAVTLYTQCDVCNPVGLISSVKFACESDSTIEIFGDKNCLRPETTLQMAPFEDVLASNCTEKLLSDSFVRVIVAPTGDRAKFSNGATFELPEVALALLLAGYVFVQLE